jgi:hypothetical protein
MTNAGKISSDDGLQFGTVETADENVPAGVSASTTCVACRQPINSTYYAVGDKVVCPSCAAQLDQPPRGSKSGRLLLASVFGLAAGLVGAIVWFAIRRVAGLEIGIVAVVVGFMVGAAVRKGSDGVGGLGYQILAVLITYCCIALNYMPDVFEGLFQTMKERDVAQAQDIAVQGNDAKVDGVDSAVADDGASKERAEVVAANDLEKAGPKMGVAEFALGVAIIFAVAFAISLAAPFLAGMQNIIGLLIIGFALWEAWKLNAYRKLPIMGPYELGKAPAVS